jgi:sugar phosphate isomerase/epimerase
VVDIVTKRNCVYQTAYHVVWCPKYRRDVLTGAVAEATGAMLDAICNERGWPVISKEIQPDHILSRWHEYARLLEEDVYYVIDLSHLNIVAAKSGRYETVLVRELLACERCIEVHLSDNDGSGDWHALCAREVWWMDLLDAIHPGAVVFSEGNQRRRDKMLA